MRLSRRARLAAPLVITVAGAAGCTPAPPPPMNPPMVTDNPPPPLPRPEPIHVNPPPPEKPALPPAADPARVEIHPDGTCWETIHGNPPMTRAVLCPSR